MNRLLATSTILLGFILLTVQVVSTTTYPSRETGTVTAFTHTNPTRVRETGITPLAEGSVLRRGDRVRTDEGFAAFTYGSLSVALAAHTEVQLTDPTHLRLIGGRLVVKGDASVQTPWITTQSEYASVVNYAWKEEVQILPLGATTTVENSSLNPIELTTGATWSEATKELSVSEEPFDPSTSSETEFYGWADQVLNK